MEAHFALASLRPFSCLRAYDDLALHLQSCFRSLPFVGLMILLLLLSCANTSLWVFVGKYEQKQVATVRKRTKTRGSAEWEGRTRHHRVLVWEKKKGEREAGKDEQMQ